MMYYFPLAILCSLLAATADAQEQTITPPPSPTAPVAETSTAPPPVSESYESRRLAGFSLMIHRDLIGDEPALLDRILIRLTDDLDEITHLVPAPALAALRQTTFWIELQGATNEGMSGRGLCCHWSEEWVVAHGLPREKTGGIEIVNPHDYLAWRSSQPYMILHELSHAYHRMLGPDMPEILEPYNAAMDAGLYAEVARNTLPLGESVKAYAAVNHHEYFAEVTEAYFALNDFAPYTRPQLAEFDPAGLEMAETLWSLSTEQIAERLTKTGLVDPP